MKYIDRLLHIDITWKRYSGSLSLLFLILFSPFVFSEVDSRIIQIKEAFSTLGLKPSLLFHSYVYPTQKNTQEPHILLLEDYLPVVCLKSEIHKHNSLATPATPEKQVDNLSNLYKGCVAVEENQETGELYLWSLTEQDGHIFSEEKLFVLENHFLMNPEIQIKEAISIAVSRSIAVSESPLLSFPHYRSFLQFARKEGQVPQLEEDLLPIACMKSIQQLKIQQIDFVFNNPRFLNMRVIHYLLTGCVGMEINQDTGELHLWSLKFHRRKGVVLPDEELFIIKRDSNLL